MCGKLVFTTSTGVNSRAFARHSETPGGTAEGSASIQACLIRKAGILTPSSAVNTVSRIEPSSFHRYSSCRFRLGCAGRTRRCQTRGDCPARRPPCLSSCSQTVPARRCPAPRLARRCAGWFRRAYLRETMQTIGNGAPDTWDCAIVWDMAGTDRCGHSQPAGGCPCRFPTGYCITKTVAPISEIFSFEAGRGEVCGRASPRPSRMT